MIEISKIPPERESEVLERALEAIQLRVPPGWSVTIQRNLRIVDWAEVDAAIQLTSPDGEVADVLVEAKRAIEARDIPRILEQLSRATDGLATTTRNGMPSASPMIVARYLSSRVRERLEEMGVNYADATGNLWLALSRPAIFLRDIGAQRDPWRGPGRTRGSFKGAPAGRVVRALADFRPPMTVPQLAERSEASAGATYRMVDLLQREAYIDREDRRGITRVDWRPMLERWSEDYEFASSNASAGFLEPRGLPELESKLRRTGLPYVITGSMAAERYARYAPSRLAMLYVEGIERAAQELELRAVEGGANVLLAAPEASFVYDRSSTIEGLNFAAPSQAAVDLLRSPGRGPSEGVALLDWMGENELVWRR